MEFLKPSSWVLRSFFNGNFLYFWFYKAGFCIVPGSIPDRLSILTYLSQFYHAFHSANLKHKKIGGGSQTSSEARSETCKQSWTIESQKMKWGFVSIVIYGYLRTFFLKTLHKWIVKIIVCNFDLEQHTLQVLVLNDGDDASVPGQRILSLLPKTRFHSRKNQRGGSFGKLKDVSACINRNLLCFGVITVHWFMPTVVRTT